MTLFLAPQTWPFAVATLVILAIAAIEGLALLIGMSLSSWLELAIDHGVEGAEGAPEGAEGAPDTWLGWLYVGKVPVLVLVVLFLALFALTGFALDFAAYGLFSTMVPAAIATPVALVAALPLVRACAAVVARLVPRDQSFAVSLDSLVGRVAVIVSGTARPGFPAQGKVVTEYGQTLYVMVEPDGHDGTFTQHDSVLLVKRVTGTRFLGIPNPRPDLL